MSIAIRTSDSLRIINDTTRISKEEMINASKIEPIILNSNLLINLKIVQFALSNMVNDSIMEAVSHDENLTDEQRAIIEGAMTGSIIYIENIRVVDSNGSIHTIPSKKIQIP